VRVSNLTGWISTQFATAYGICTTVPVATPPITPTVFVPTLPPPTSTLTLPPPSLTPGPADLVVTGINGPTNLSLSGGTVTSNYSVTITNTGASPTGAFNNVIAVNPPGAETALGIISNLAPGESIVLNVNLTFNTPGTYTITARADSANQVPEASEVNNSGTASVVVN
jgi:subtilase family serine protease